MLEKLEMVEWYLQLLSMNVVTPYTVDKARAEGNNDVDAKKKNVNEKKMSEGNDIKRVGNWVWPE